MPYRVVLLLVLLAPAVALAGAEPGDPFLIADIHRAGESPYPVSSFLRVGDVAVFVQDKPSGDELWVSDGTDAGTRELGVECADPACGIVLGPSDGSRAFFAFAPGDLSVQLGVTDTTPQGTRLLTDFGPGHGLSGLRFSKGPSGFLGGRLLFAAEDARGLELWRTDGTRGGTRLLVDLRPGESGGFRSWEGVTGSFRMFFADDGVHGTELWSTDGTAMGTVRLGVPPVDPFHFVLAGAATLGNRLVFLVPRDGLPTTLWVTDGTAEGTRRLRELILPDRVFVGSSGLVAGDALAFFATQHASDGVPDPFRFTLWRTDGTAEGTVPLVSSDQFRGKVPSLQAVVEESLFFAWNAGDGIEPWTSDGTAAGTRQVADVCPGPGSSNPRFLFTLGDDLVYRARDCERSNLPVNEVGLWSVLGGPGPDLCPGPCSSDPELLAVTDDGTAYLTADRGFEGRELWRIDPEGDLRSDLTRLTELPVREPFLAAPLSSGFQPDLPGTALADRVVFLAVDPVTGLGLYRTDGTAQGTELVETLAPAANRGSSPRELTRLADEVVFVADDGFDPPGLWTSDFTPAGTRAVEFEPGILEDDGPFSFPARGPYRFRDLQSGGSRLFFWIELPEGHFVPGVLQPGSPARPFVPEPESFVGVPATASDPPEPPPFYLAGDRFFAFSGPVGPSLTMTDGTAEGTRTFGAEVDSPFTPAAPLGSRLVYVGLAALAPDVPQPALYVNDGFGDQLLRLLPGEVEPPMVAAGRHVYFNVGGPEPGVWVTDGTVQGTRRLPGEDPRPEEARVMVPDGNRVFLFGFAESERFLWVTDGTAPGTRILTDDVDLEFTQPRTDAFAVVGRELFFLEAGFPPMLWASDGTVAGTGPRNLLPADVEPLELHAAGGRLVIVARRGFDAPEVELWVSDGTPEGTHLSDRTFPDPSGFEGLGGRVLFAADGGVAGRELWGFTTSGETGPCAPAPRTLCLTQDRFRVEVDWHDLRSGDSGPGNVLPGTTLDDSGFFWFFDPANVELIVKVLDARPVNGHFWVFTGSLTDVERTITITDTVTGQVNVYERAAGNPTGQIDVTAF